MKLNHIHLTVTDATETAQFLEKYFGLRRMEGVKHKKTFAMMRDDDGLVLTLIRGRQAVEIEYAETFPSASSSPAKSGSTRSTSA